MELLKSEIEIWGGIECSFNRVADRYTDQLELAGHYKRKDDIGRLADLGIKALRYPVLWEKHCPVSNSPIDWTHTEEVLIKLRELNITPIAGLVHHGSGPSYTNMYDDSFAEGLASYAAKVAAEFPWLEYYTPINEPLTTARFCGLYGHWYPHGTSDSQFLRILYTECKATVLAMKAIRLVNPDAKLVQTEDLGKTHSTETLKYQAEFENTRRWLSLDFLCGRVTPGHPLYTYLVHLGITEEELSFFSDDPCPPSIIGINHYITSERFIDENRDNYPSHTWGGNGRDNYADVEAVRVSGDCMAGPYNLFKEAWERYNLPMAITEVHLHCTREEQMRWFHYIWRAANELKKDGADIRAVTAWAMLGSFEWCSLLTRVNGDYESGLFDITGLTPRPTALATMAKALASEHSYTHPVLEDKGWWERPCRVSYITNNTPVAETYVTQASRPVMITGKTGALGQAFGRICQRRGMHYIILGRDDLDIANPGDIEKIIREYNPWSIINTAGFERIDAAESDPENCFRVNSIGPREMAYQCNKYDVKFVTFSSDLVFDGKKRDPYLESDVVSPINVYGESKVRAEHGVMASNPGALIIRTSAFFGPWDSYNFVANALYSFKHKLPFKALSDVTVSPTYLPDLVNITLDLLLDDESGIWNITNKGEISWARLAGEVAERAGYSSRNMDLVSLSEMKLPAPRPRYSVLKSEKGFELPSMNNALERFFNEQQLMTI